jgi:dipeptidase
MCDTLAATGTATATGSVLFAKNSDREFDEAQYLDLIPAADHRAQSRVSLTYAQIDQVPHTYTVLLSKPHWIWGAEIGANEHGLVIGNEALHTRIAPGLEPGIIGMDYLRLALERARSVEEAIEVITGLLREHGQSGNCGFRRTIGYHNAFLLADRNGAKVLETVDREWVAAPVRDVYAISNIISIPDFERAYEDPAKVASGRHRRARATELLKDASGTLRLTDMFRILRDHKEGVPPPGRSNGPRICAHSRENPLGQTTASWVADLAPGKTVHWVTGTAAPCTGVFKPIVLEAGVPSHGPKPGAEEDAISLWWRHEQIRRVLDESPADVRERFDAERTALENELLQTMRASSDAGAAAQQCWRAAIDWESSWYERLLTPR